MTRKMAYIGIPYLLGLFFGSFFAVQINLGAIFIIFLLGILSIIFFKKERKRIVAVCLSFIIALSYNVLYTTFNYNKILELADTEVTFEGEITYYNKVSSDFAVVHLDGIINDDIEGKLSAFIFDTTIDFNDKVTMTATLETVDNTFEFATEDYLKSKGIYLQVDKLINFEVEENPAFSLVDFLGGYRDYLSDVIMSYLPGEEGQLLTSMVTGNDELLAAETELMLQNIGIGHILAVSGTHLMILCGVLLFVLKTFRLGKITRFVIIEIFVLAFILFSGGSMSTIRAGIMFTLLMLATLVNRQRDILSSIGIAGIIMTIGNPYVVRDASFLLSFLGVFGIAYVAPKMCKEIYPEGKFKKIIYPIITAVTICVVTFPGVMLYFDRFSIIAPIANLIVTPLCVLGLNFGFIVGLIGGIPFITPVLLLFAGLFLKLGLFLGEIIASFKFATIPIGDPVIPIAVIFALIFGTVLFIIFRKYKPLLISFTLSILIVVSSGFITFHQKQDDLVITILGERYSSGIIIEMGVNIVVIDFEGKGDIAEITSKYIERMTNEDISLLVLTKEEQFTISTYLNEFSRNFENITFLNDVYVNTNENIRVLAENEEIVIGELTMRIGEEHLEISKGKFNLICDEKNGIINSNSFVPMENSLYFGEENNEKILVSSEGYSLLQQSGNYDFGVIITIDENDEYKVRRM